MSTFTNYLSFGASALPPVTAALCQACAAGVNPTDAARLGPTPTAAALSAVVDAIHQLETSLATVVSGA
jgi:hypothetical protein